MSTKPEHHKLRKICDEVCVPYGQVTEVLKRIADRVLNENAKITTESVGTFYCKQAKGRTYKLKGNSVTKPDRISVGLMGNKIESQIHEIAEEEDDAEIFEIDFRLVYETDSISGDVFYNFRFDDLRLNNSISFESNGRLFVFTGTNTFHERTEILTPRVDRDFNAISQFLSNGKLRVNRSYPSGSTPIKFEDGEVKEVDQFAIDEEAIFDTPSGQVTIVTDGIRIREAGKLKFEFLYSLVSPFPIVLLDE